jgi:hypothetical protein
MLCKKPLACTNASVVVENAAVIGLAPGLSLFCKKNALSKLKVAFPFKLYVLASACR